MSLKVGMVTGGAGFIGSHACLSLLESDFQVVAIDNLSNCFKDDKTPHPESLVRVQILAGKKLKFYPVDLLNPTALKEVFQDVMKEYGRLDFVIHCAALKAVGESCEKPLEYYKNNVAGTINLVEVMRQFNCKNLIYSSSATVYGDPKTLPIKETDPTGGNTITNPYGRTKFITEQILEDLVRAEKDWKVITLRYFNPVGAHPSGLIGEDPSGIPNNLMPYLCRVASGRLPELSVYGSDYPTKDGTGVRDYIHIIDLIDGHIKAAEYLVNEDNMKTDRFKVFNLGTGRGYSVLEVVKAFERASNLQIAYKIVGRRAGDVAASYCDPALANRELKWCATRNIDDMCEDTWRWTSKNPYGYRVSVDSTECWLHSPGKLGRLLDVLTRLELAATEAQLHIDYLNIAQKIKMREEYEKLRRLREAVKALELYRLSRGEGRLCEKQQWKEMEKGVPFCDCKQRSI